MNVQACIQAQDRQGWSKEFSLEHALTYIGSDATNDIVLPMGSDGQIAGRHLQMIRDGEGYRLVNLTNTPVRVRHARSTTGSEMRPNSTTLDAHGTHRLEGGETLSLGDYDITIAMTSAVEKLSSERVDEDQAAKLCACSYARATSPSISLELTLPHTTMGLAPALAPDAPLKAIIGLWNDGSASPAQLRLELEGLGPDDHDLPLGAVLFPGAETRLPFEIRHPRSSSVPANERRITIRATAPNDYPGVLVALDFVVNIAAYYAHSMRQLNPSPSRRRRWRQR